MTHGKVCIASSAGGLSEIAPGLVDVVDPHDPGAMAKAVRSYLVSPERLADREAAIKRTYRSTSWRDCAAEVGGLLRSALPS
jgi:glycosyltransferase involved in cell wall biosynthesis